MGRLVSWLAIVGCFVVGCGAGELSALPLSDAAVDTDAYVAEARADASPAELADAAVASPPDTAASDAGSDATPGKSAPDAGQPSWLISPGDSVFFVGNSFFGEGDRVLPEWVEAIGQATSFPIETGSHLQPGDELLSWFFEQPASQQAIASKQYDVFVLQGYEWEAVEHPDTFEAAVRAYHDAITANGGRVMLFMTWAFPRTTEVYPDFYARLVANYDAIGRKLNIPVIPVGQIYHDVNEDLPPGEQAWFLLQSDLFHQGAGGSAVNAYATFMMLTGIDPRGVAFSVRNNDNSPELLQYLSAKSWAAVAPRLQE